MPPAAIAALLIGALGAPCSARAAEVSFLREIAPILLQRCAGCHGPAKREGDFRLHTFEALLKPGASEAKPVVAGKPDESELLLRITDTDEGTRMPQQDDPLSADEIALIRRWIAAGAGFDGRDPKGAIKAQMPPRIHPAAPPAYRVPVPIYALAFSPNGSELAVGGHHEVTIWNPETGALLRRIPSLPQRVHSLIYTRDGLSLVVGGGSPGDYGEVALVELAPQGAGARRVLGTFDDVVLSAPLSHDGTRVVATAADRSVRAFRTADGSPLWQSPLHSDWVTCAAFSHDDRFVATGSKDFTVKVLDAETGALFTTYNGHQRQYGKETGRFEVFALAFSQDGPQAFSAGEGRSIRVWEPELAQTENGSAADMEQRFAKAGHTRYITHDAKHAVFKLVVGGSDLFAATGDGIVRQYNLSSLELVRDYTGHRNWVFAADCHTASRRLATGAFDGEVRVWDTTTGALVQTFVAAPGTMRHE